MKAVVFSGTSEGREITEYLNNKGVETFVSVATEYGKDTMEDMAFVKIHSGRLEGYAMAEFIKGCDFVIDATHPYAQNVTKNIVSICCDLNIEYIRLLREDIAFNNGITVNNIEEAVNYLKNTEGRIFVSTGSKELHFYSQIPDYKNRLVARVLPLEDSIEKIKDLGLKNVIYGKGPFTYEENIEAFKKYSAKWLVTKSSGKNGGFEEKIEAAMALNMNIVVIKRPCDEKGYNMEEVKAFIDKKLSINYKKFPLFINLAGENVIVVGGGNIAVRRINTLLKFGARIKVVADKIQKENIEGKVEIIERKFLPSDIENAMLVVAATNDRDVNNTIYNICNERNIPVSVADNRDECSFYFPAVCLNDKLSIGIVSNGDEHSIVRAKAAEIRRLIDDE